MSKQQVIFNIEWDGEGDLNIKLDFEPALAGDESLSRAAMSDTEQMLQNYAADIAGKVMDLLKKENN